MGQYLTESKKINHPPVDLTHTVIFQKSELVKKVIPEN